MINKIQYIVIQKNKVKNIISSNHNYENAILGDLRYYPQNLFQFRANFDFLNHVKSKDGTGIQVLFFNIEDMITDNNFDKLLFILKAMQRVSVFFFSFEVANHFSLLLDKVRQSKLPAYYFSIFDIEREIQVKDEKFYFKDHHDFYKLMARDAKKIAKHVASKIKSFKGIEFKPSKEVFRDIEYVHFKPIISNVINIYSADNITNIIQAPQWDIAPLEERQEKILDSIQDLDNMHRAWGKENSLQSEQHYLPTLILLFPFHNPLLSKLYKSNGNNIFTKILLAEQADNYTYIIKGVDEESTDDETRLLIRKALNIQTQILDSIAYLHSSFQISPVIRFPIKTSALKQIVSIFSVSNKKGIVQSGARHRSILKLGKKLKETYLQAPLEEYLSRRNGQILVISDLPIEWMLIKGVPLGFLSDVCRIQDSNIQGLLNNYSAYSKINFSPGSDTIKKTLVIFSDRAEDRRDFEKPYRQAQEFQKTDGFSIALAKNAQDVKQLVETFRPHLLIFDCHCGFDKEKSTSFLQIGEDKIYPEIIVKLNIGAPLVYLASCHTNPNYDNIEKLHDAFFEAGTLSVTGTFLPLDMYKGSFVYLRMLRLLKSENERAASGNWLHFVSFAIRTSLVWEARLKCLIRRKRQLTADEESVFLKILEKLHRFEERCEVFHQLQKNGIKLSDDLTLTIAETDLEFMYYSHYGRPDLIIFKD